MKKLPLILFFALGFQGLYAQTGAFKKILSDKETVNKEVFYDQLIAFQKENVEFSNVYFQLGKFEMDNFLSLDPIVDRVASRQRVYNAKTNFGLAKNYLDEKEIARFPDWYDAPDLKDKDSVTSVGLSNVNDNFENAGDYAVEYEELVKNYDRAVFHYLRAREGFIQINTSADNLRQLFLKADDSLKIAVREVGVSFDSSMYHLDIYRDIYQQIPYKKVRKVNVNKQKIDHFRMNGITPANFLADDIDVWDYKEWSERFLELLREEVDGLQDEIKTAFQFFMATNERMISGDECIQAELDDLKFQRIINLITKYDNQSVLIEIFQYLIAKLEYGNKLAYERNCNQLDMLPTDDYLSRKVRIYQNLYSSFDIADSLNTEIVQGDESQASFQWFFDDQMPGENGSAVFANEQELQNKNSFKAELDKFFQSVKIQRFDADTISERLEIDSIYLVSGSSAEDGLLVRRKMMLEDSLLMFSGSIEDKNVLVAASPLGEDYQMNWKVELNKNAEMSFFKIVGDSSFVAGGVQGNAWFTQYSLNGGEFYTSVLKSSDSIVDVRVNQLQGIATVVQQRAQGLTISKVNFNGKVTSSKAIDTQGSYVGMASQEQDMWIFVASENEEGVTISALAYNEKEDTVEPLQEYKAKSVSEDLMLIKNDNEYLTILSKSPYSDDEFVYAILNYEGEIIHETTF